MKCLLGVRLGRGIVRHSLRGECELKFDGLQPRRGVAVGSLPSGGNISHFLLRNEG